jgi:hypothetical protein
MGQREGADVYVPPQTMRLSEMGHPGCKSGWLENGQPLGLVPVTN